MPSTAFSSAQGRARRWRACAAFLLALLFLPASLPAFADGYAITATPAWVLVQQPGPAFAKAAPVPAGQAVTYLLVDNQVLSTRASRTRYFRYVSQARTAKGVESIANVSVDYDPGWQQLQLHAVRVLRDGRAIDKLAGARIEVIQQEKELDELIYNGSKTVKLFLDDVRVGDVVDYSFSTVGRNPVFGEREFGGTDLQWGVPVARLHARLLVPATTALAVRTRNSPLQPVVSEHDGLRDYRWSARDTTALTVEAGAPEWYAPFAEVEWSAFPDWASVSRWAQPLYRVPSSLGPELEAEVRRIAREQPGQTARMLEVLRFVQREVRYLGVETGRNTHAPNPPAQVFARRFGDCKDKALLMLSLLSRLGIEGHPALVNTRSRRGIAERLPTPTAFDHVIVRVRADGKDYWLDPTRATQEGDAAYVYQPDFHLALVVAPGTTALTPMRNPGSRSRRSVHIVLDARRSFEQPVRFRVVTTYEGGSAEAQRESFADATLASVQDDYLEYYAGSYPGISLAAPMQVSDDKRRNRLVVTESYAIAGIAGKADQDGRHTVWIETPDVDELLKDPETKLRKSPLELRFPLEVSHTTEVLLPEDWELKPSEEHVDDPAFRFSRSVRPDADGRRLVIQDEYRGLADEVSAREVPRYTASLAKARDELGYSLYWTDALPPPPASVAGARWLDRINWSLLLLSLAALALFARLARAAWRYDPDPAPPVAGAPIGVGGWLLLYLVPLLSAPAARIQAMLDGLPKYAMPQWSALTSFGGAQYHPGWAPLLLGEWLANLGLLVASALLALVFFQRRSNFPRLAVALMAGSLAWFVLDLGLASAMQQRLPAAQQWGQLAGLVVGTALWSAYLLVSRRVGATFVRRLRPVPSPVLVVDVRLPPPLPEAERSRALAL